MQVLFLVHDLGANPTVVGAVVACSGIGGILGALGAIRITRRFGSARGLLLCLLTALPCTVLIPSAFPGPGLLLAAVGNLVPAAGIVAANVIIAAFRQTYPPPHIRGRVIATGSMASYAADPVGAILAGTLGTALGVRPAIWIMAGVVLGAGALMPASPLRGIRDLPTAPLHRLGLTPDGS